MADIIPIRNEGQKSLQEVIREFKGPMGADTKEHLEGLHQHLKENPHKFDFEDMRYMVNAIHFLFRINDVPVSGKTNEKSYLAEIVVKEYMMSQLEQGFRDDLLYNMEYCSNPIMGPNILGIIAEEFLEKYDERFISLQLYIIKDCAEKIVSSLKDMLSTGRTELLYAERDITHYVNNYVSRIANDSFIAALEDKIQERYREAA